MPSLRLIIFTLVLAAAGCAANKPVIYPNTHSQSVGTGQIEADIAASGATASLLHAFFKKPRFQPNLPQLRRALLERSWLRPCQLELI